MDEYPISIASLFIVDASFHIGIGAELPIKQHKQCKNCKLTKLLKRCILSKTDRKALIREIWKATGHRMHNKGRP
jgi:hypothetical protein